MTYPPLFPSGRNGSAAIPRTPVGGGSLGKAPKKLDTVSYLRFPTVSKNVRPVLRNHSVRAYRPAGPEGPEIDVDVVPRMTPIAGSSPAHPASRSPGSRAPPPACPWGGSPIGASGHLRAVASWTCAASSGRYRMPSPW
ncbi:hypothetical protein Airi01_018440 [Actinoallomurus iriomotensis]|uniref:Uncharacterized protein n=1 Tax=Actinoallomurus iriomotensis TaxID=478107 RepID=A0A9W6RGD5_9ACTN|nr:hypothetical protein Airi01_018440 [Actinoallomurus iriomotensis]